MNAAGRRLSESRVRENLMHGLRWQAMETETTARFEVAGDGNGNYRAIA